MTDKLHDFLYGNQITVYACNNSLIYILSTARLDATKHRWLASLGSFNFKLAYRRGKSNGDADVCSRRPQNTKKMFPDVDSAICEPFTVSHNNCPLAANLVVTSCAANLGPDYNASVNFKVDLN